MATIEVVRGNETGRIEARRGENLLEALRGAGWTVTSACGGRKTCGKCRVVIDGEDEVLACSYTISGDMVVRLATHGKAAILESGARVLKEVSPNPGIRDTVHDGTRVTTCLGKKILRGVATDPRPALHGLAVDIGTTTVVAYLENLYSGTTVGHASFLNPQAQFGQDVVSRIHHTIEHPSGLEELRTAIVRGINEAAGQLMARHGIAPEALCKASMAGNTTMLHLLLGVDPSPIAYAPYTPAFTEARTPSAAEVGLEINPQAPVCVLPSVSGYVGADITAGVASTDLLESDSLTLYIDLGTNGEMVLGTREAAWCCATAAGPAFEGARIACGMGGVSGAVSRFGAEGYETVDNAPAAGICGSGLLDIVAYLLSTGIVDGSGYMEQDFTVVDAASTATGQPIVLTPRDIRETQLATAAIHAGILVLVTQAGLSLDRIERVYLAGGFGTFMRVDSAVAVGLLPEALGCKVTAIGNSAGTGARLALRSTEFAAEVARAAARLEYIELSMRMDFNELYVESMALGRR